MVDNNDSSKQIVIHNHPQAQSWFGKMFVRMLLIISILGNVSLFGLYQQYYPQVVKNERFVDGDEFAEDKIALIKVSGMILSETVQSPIKELELAAEDDAVKAVVLKVSTPGGTIGGSDELYNAILKYKRESQKPIVVSMQTMATSGGYYISAPADKIFADRSCMTASVGVILSGVNLEKLMNAYGVDAEVVKSGKFKDSLSMYRAMTDEERAMWQKMIDEMYQQFLDIVTEHRSDHVSEESLRELEGRVLLAAEAEKLGLIDQIGHQDDAIAEAVKMGNVADKYRVVSYRRPITSVLDLLSGSVRSQNSIDIGRLLQLQMPQPLLLPGLFIGEIK